MCGRLVVICRSCDRGNIYCFGECSKIRRQESCRRASRIYQKTFRGKVKHAACQARHRAIQDAKSREKNEMEWRERDTVSVCEKIESEGMQIERIDQVVLEEVTDHGSQNAVEYGSLVIETSEPEAHEPAIVELRDSEPAINAATLSMSPSKHEPRNIKPAEMMAKRMECCHGCGSWCGMFLRLEAWQGGRQYGRQRGKKNDRTRRNRSRNSPIPLC